MEVVYPPSLINSESGVRIPLPLLLTFFVFFQIKIKTIAKKKKLLYICGLKSSLINCGGNVGLEVAII